MTAIKYDGKKINNYISNLTSLDEKFNSLLNNLKEGTNTVVSARGFNEYIGGINSDFFSQYVEEGRSNYNNLVQEIRNKQIQILAYNQDEGEIKAFLDTLDRKDYKTLDLSPIEDHISLGRKAGNFFKGIGSSIFTAGAGLVEGVLDFGETGADLITLGGTSVASIFTSGYDFMTGSDSTEKMWEQTKAFVSKKHVESVFNSFYDNTEFGQEIKNNAYAFEGVRGISKGLGYTGGMIGANILTGGLASGAGIAAQGTIGVSQLALTAGVMGFSNGTEEAWADGATITSGLKYGVATGAWEGIQWGLGAKIGQIGGIGDQVAGKIFGTAVTATKAAATRIGLDTIDSAAEGFVQPALKMLYKDYEGTNIIEKYKSAFNKSGGWTNVGTQAVMGGFFSALGEIGNARKLLKSNEMAEDRILDSEMRDLAGFDDDKLAQGVFAGEGVERLADGADYFASDSLSIKRTIDGYGIRSGSNAFNMQTGKNLPKSYQWFQDGSYLPSSTASINSLDQSIRGIFQNYEVNISSSEAMNIIDQSRMMLSAFEYTKLKKATEIVGDSLKTLNLNELKLIVFHSEGNIGRIKSALAMSYKDIPENVLNDVSNKLAKELFRPSFNNILVNNYITSLQKYGLDNWESSNTILKGIDSDRILKSLSKESNSDFLKNVNDYFGGRLSKETAIKIATSDGYPATIKKILLDDKTIPSHMVDVLATGSASNIFATRNLARLKSLVEVDNQNLSKAVQLVSKYGDSFEGYSDLLCAANVFSEESTRKVYYSIIDNLVNNGYSLKDATMQARLMNSNAVSRLGKNYSFSNSASDIFTLRDAMFSWDDSIFASVDNKATTVFASNYMIKHYKTANGIDTNAIIKDFRKLMHYEYDNMEAIKKLFNNKIDVDSSRRATKLFADAYTAAASNVNNPNQGEALKFMSKILELNEQGKKIFVVNDAISGSCAGGNKLNLDFCTVDGKIFGTIFHENGHAIFDNVLNSKYPSDFDAVRSRACSILKDSHSKGLLDSYENNVKEVSYYINYKVDKSFQSVLKKNGFSSIDEYRQYLIKNYSNLSLDQRVSRLQYQSTRNGYITGGAFEEGFRNKLDYKNINSCVDIEISAMKKKIRDKIFRTEFSDYELISSIIDSATMGKIRYNYGHGQTYFERFQGYENRFSYHELIADYSNLKVSGNNKVIKYLRNILGDELFNTIDSTYQSMLK